VTDKTPASPTLPIVIASGFSPIPLPLSPGIRRLRKKGCDIMVVPFRLEDMRDVETFAHHIVIAVEEAAARSPTGRINLVGLSMGGVASLHAIKRLDMARLVDTFIAVGAPFHGSAYSWFALPTIVFTRTGNQLSTKSSYLKRLRNEPLPLNTRFITIAGRDDRICPPTSALLKGTEQVIGDFDHQAIFRTVKVHDLFVSFCR